jgi:hypothetical protein
MSGSLGSISLEKIASRGGAGTEVVEERVDAASASAGRQGAPGENEVACATLSIVSVRLDQIIDDRPRDRRGPDDELSALQESILTLGQTAPIVLTRAPEGAEAPYILVAGRRRLDAKFALAARHGREHWRIDAVVHDPMDLAERIARQIADNCLARRPSESEYAQAVLDLDRTTRRHVLDLLGFDKTKRSHLKAILETVPTWLLRSIGGHPRLGRGPLRRIGERWSALDPDTRRRVVPELKRLLGKSDDPRARAREVLAFLTKHVTDNEEAEQPEEPDVGDAEAEAVPIQDAVDMLLRPDDEAGFAAYVAERMPGWLDGLRTEYAMARLCS